MKIVKLLIYVENYKFCKSVFSFNITNEIDGNFFLIQSWSEKMLSVQRFADSFAFRQSNCFYKKNIVNNNDIKILVQFFLSRQPAKKDTFDLTRMFLSNIYLTQSCQFTCFKTCGSLSTYCLRPASSFTLRSSASDSLNNIKQKLTYVGLV